MRAELPPVLMALLSCQRPPATTPLGILQRMASFWRSPRGRETVAATMFARHFAGRVCLSTSKERSYFLGSVWTCPLLNWKRSGLRVGRRVAPFATSDRLSVFPKLRPAGRVLLRNWGVTHRNGWSVGHKRSRLSELFVVRFSRFLAKQFAHSMQPTSSYPLCHWS